MGASYGKGDYGKATRLHAELVRRRGACQRCGKKRGEVQLQCAHIISRQFSATRTELSNAFCLCATCHRYFGNFPPDFAEFVYMMIGKTAYEELRERALLGVKMNWTSEVERLTKIKGEMDEADRNADSNEDG